MRALTVVPGQKNSLAVREIQAPRPGPGELLVRGVALGICGTDREIASGGAGYGWAPPGQDYLVLGHESLGRVEQSCGDFAAGDLVVGVVRRPDPVPCGACGDGQWDFCQNGRYTERGIKQRDGYGSEFWCVETDFAVRVPPELGPVAVLTEPTSVVAKAWDQIEAVGRRGWFAPRRVLITGAGPVGLLAALLAAQRGLQVHVLDRVSDGPKSALANRLGATYHHADAAEVIRDVRPDIVIEATGADPIVVDVLAETSPSSVVCLTGVSGQGRTVTLDVGAINRAMVLDNQVVVGSVNANLRHYHAAVEALSAAEPDWLADLITRRITLDDIPGAFEPAADDVKVVVHLSD